MATEKTNIARPEILVAFFLTSRQELNEILVFIRDQNEELKVSEQRILNGGRLSLPFRLTSNQPKILKKKNYIISFKFGLVLKEVQWLLKQKRKKPQPSVEAVESEATSPAPTLSRRLHKA